MTAVRRVVITYKTAGNTVATIDGTALSINMTEQQATNAVAAILAAWPRVR